MAEVMTASQRGERRNFFVVERFGMTVEEGSTGGSGVALYNGALYAEEDGRILRYQLGQAATLRRLATRLAAAGRQLLLTHPSVPHAVVADTVVPCRLA
jgi:hypothetical protein